MKGVPADMGQPPQGGNAARRLRSYKHVRDSDLEPKAPRSGVASASGGSAIPGLADSWQGSGADFLGSRKYHGDTPEAAAERMRLAEIRLDEMRRRVHKHTPMCSQEYGCDRRQDSLSAPQGSAEPNNLREPRSTTVAPSTAA